MLSVPEVASTLVLQVRLHGAVDGRLGSFHCGLGENLEDLHCHLDALVLVPPQVRLHHPRVQREHAHPAACAAHFNDLLKIGNELIPIAAILNLNMKRGNKKCSESVS